MTTLVLPETVRQTILNAAARSPKTEICGLLTGRDGAVEQAHLSPNLHPVPSDGFAVCDRLYARLQRAGRRRGLRVTGCFHSHPRGDTSPSQTDLLAVQEDGFIWVICNPAGELRAWRARIKIQVKWFDELTVANVARNPHCAADAGTLMSPTPLAPIV